MKKEKTQKKYGQKIKLGTNDSSIPLSIYFISIFIFSLGILYFLFYFPSSEKLISYSPVEFTSCGQIVAGDCFTPGVRILYSDGTAIYYPPQNITGNTQIEFTDSHVRGTIRYVGEHLWELEVTPLLVTIDETQFPYQKEGLILGGDISDDISYELYWLGIIKKVDQQTDIGKLDYPGSLSAPLVIRADDYGGIIISAANWPPKKVSLWDGKNQYTGDQTVFLQYQEPIATGSTQVYRSLIGRVVGNNSEGNSPWQNAMDLYKNWIRPHMVEEGLYPLDYSSWMKSSEGFLNLGVMNSWAEFNQADIDSINAQIEKTQGNFTWILIWGQMSNYPGTDLNGVYPPLASGEEVGCCLQNSTMHSRYTEYLLPFVNEATTTKHFHVGYYTRPREYPENINDLDSSTIVDGITNLEYLLAWQEKNTQDYYANSYYIDVLGALPTDDPLATAHLIGNNFVHDTVIERYLDIYPSPFLLSGSLTLGDINGMPSHTKENLGNGYSVTTYPNLGRYLIDDSMIFMGGSNGDWRYWSGTNYSWTIRQAFLLGAKFDVILSTVTELNGTRNEALDLALQERQRVHWWDRWPVYKDTRNLTEIPATVQARHFIGNDGHHLIVIDNYDSVKNSTLKVFGKPYVISESKLSILDIGDDSTLFPKNEKVDVDRSSSSSSTKNILNTTNKTSLPNQNLSGDLTSCITNWKCTGTYDDCVQGKQVEICFDQNNCMTSENKPHTSRECASEVRNISQPERSNPLSSDIWSIFFGVLSLIIIGGFLILIIRKRQVHLLKNKFYPTEAKKFISHARDLGYTDEQIHKMLNDKGLTDDEVFTLM